MGTNKMAILLLSTIVLSLTLGALGEDDDDTRPNRQLGYPPHPPNGGFFAGYPGFQGGNMPGYRPGGTIPDGYRPGGTMPGPGYRPGGTMPGGYRPGGTMPGGYRPGGTMPEMTGGLYRPPGNVGGGIPPAGGVHGPF